MFKLLLFVLSIAVISLSYYVIVDHRIAIVFFLFSAILAIFLTRRLSIAIWLGIVLLTTSPFFLANFLFSPDDNEQSLKILIFRVSRQGFEIGLTKWFTRAGSVVIGFIWILKTDLVEIGNKVTNLPPRLMILKKWSMILLSFCNNEKVLFEDYYKSLLSRGIGFSCSFSKNIQIIVLIAKKYSANIFGKISEYALIGESHFYERHSSIETKKLFTCENVKLQYTKVADFQLHITDFIVEESSFIALEGANKTGKTTFLKFLSGSFVKLEGGWWSGSFCINGKFYNQENIDQLSFAQIATDIRYLSDKIYDSFIGLNPLQELSIYTRDVKKIDELLNKFGILHLKQRPNKHLSGGEKLKVLICSLLIQNPKILLLDDVIGQLDFKSRGQLIQELEKFKNKHNSILIGGESSRVFSALVTKKYCIEAGNLITQNNNLNPDYTFNFISQRGTNDELLLLQDYSIKISESILIEEINLRLQKSQIICILGDNGTGKTTLGLSLSDEIIKFQKNITTKGLKQLHGEVRYVFQNPHLQFSERSGLKEILLEQKLNKKNIDLNIIKNLALEYNIPLDQQISDIHQMDYLLLGLLISILFGDLIILDEPTNGLDYDGRLKLNELINYGIGEGKSFIVISHDRKLISSIDLRYEVKHKKLYESNWES